jgi:hypothetical protein
MSTKKKGSMLRLSNYLSGKNYEKNNRTITQKIKNGITSGIKSGIKSGKESIVKGRESVQKSVNQGKKSVTESVKAIKQSTVTKRDGVFDTTLRSICFGIKKVLPNNVPSVSRDIFTGKTDNLINFMKYEHALYICAQLSRIVYCDSGIIWNVMNDFGKSNTTVNDSITKFDKQYQFERTIPVFTQLGEPGSDRPHESYSLTKSNGENPYGIYISTPSECTVLVVKASKMNREEINHDIMHNNVFENNDVFVTFRGTSSFKNIKHDLLSQFQIETIGKLMEDLLYDAPILEINKQCKIPKSFVQSLLKAFRTILKAIIELSDTKDLSTNDKLFITGHSLGGAYSTLFGFILGEVRKKFIEDKTIDTIDTIINKYKTELENAKTGLKNKKQQELYEYIRNLRKKDEVIDNIVASIKQIKSIGYNPEDSAVPSEVPSEVPSTVPSASVTSSLTKIKFMKQKDIIKEQIRQKKNSLEMNNMYNNFIKKSNIITKFANASTKKPVKSEEQRLVDRLEMLINLYELFKRFKSIHIITFGAPRCLSDRARNAFNESLDLGILTCDRVANKADNITHVPLVFNHPGFRPLKTEHQPEAGGRPYQIHNIRTYYGVQSTKEGRDCITWPFTTECLMKLNIKSSESIKLAQKQIDNAEKTTSGGFGGLVGTESLKYKNGTKKHMPNYINYKYLIFPHWAHVEYLGMTFMGAFRIPGRGYKNCATTHIAYFKLNNEGVNIDYLPTSDRLNEGADIYNGQSLGGTRKLRKRKITKKTKSS